MTPRIPRRERRIAHEWRTLAFHTHERVSRFTPRKGRRIVAVRCTSPNCPERTASR